MKKIDMNKIEKLFIVMFIFAIITMLVGLYMGYNLGYMQGVIDTDFRFLNPNVIK